MHLCRLSSPELFKGSYDARGTLVGKSMVPPLSATGTYQLVILGHDSDATVAASAVRLDQALVMALSHLGADPAKLLTRIRSNATTPALNRRMPTVAVFFGLVESPSLSPVDSERLACLLQDGMLIIPVVADTARFQALVPEEISHLNGVSVSDCGTGFERLASRVLEGFQLLREVRRLFISYRRVETSGVAAQLYETLDAAGFDVFLDTHGVLRPGEPFQEILWHRLADTDLAILLDSPGFLASRWTEEELARANTSKIQILQILWPGQEEGATAAFSTFHPLDAGDFEGSETLGHAARLREPSVAAIVDLVEGLRARAIGARHSFLVREFFLEARKAGLTVRTALNRTLILSGHGRDPILLQPTVGVPDSERYQILETFHRQESERGRSFSVPPILLYDQTGVRPRWLSHLEWLNGNLSCVRSISIVEAQNWLHSLSHPALTGRPV